jgi:hypothetical protein
MSGKRALDVPIKTEVEDEKEGEEPKQSNEEECVTSLSGPKPKKRKGVSHCFLYYLSQCHQHNNQYNNQLNINNNKINNISNSQHNHKHHKHKITTKQQQQYIINICNIC